MNDIAQYISGSEKITNVFGYWPSFHDAEVINFHLWRGHSYPAQNRWEAPTLTVLVHLWELTNEVAPDGFYVLKHHTLATLRFHGVYKLELDDFNFQNAIYGLALERKEHSVGPSPYFTVTFEGSFGIEATFECLHIEVVDAKPQVGEVTESL